MPAPLITIDSNRMSGAPTIRGSRLLVTTLFNHLANGGTVDSFVDEYRSGVDLDSVCDVVFFAGEHLASMPDIVEASERYERTVEAERA